MRQQGPRWLGIGAQRCGTTWLTDLLLQHPQVGLIDGRKELHALHRGVVDGPDPRLVDDYRDLFDLPGELGECTPYYLRAVWAPGVAVRAIAADAPVWCILRDPVERFASALRHELQRAERRGDVVDARWERLICADATWAGMYADQLDAWERAIGRSRLMVLQYEVMRCDPLVTVQRLWRAMGLSPVALRDIDKPSATSTRASAFDVDRHPELRRSLRELYAPQVDRLVSRWAIDSDAWPNFAQG